MTPWGPNDAKQYTKKASSPKVDGGPAIDNPKHPAGIYVTRSPRGLELEHNNNGLWEVFGGDEVGCGPDGEILAGPFTPADLLKLSPLPTDRPLCNCVRYHDLRERPQAIQTLLGWLTERLHGESVDPGRVNWAQRSHGPGHHDTIVHEWTFVEILEYLPKSPEARPQFLSDAKLGSDLPGEE